VSAGREKPRGRGRTEGCLGSWTSRISSLRQRTQGGIHDDGGTDLQPMWTAAVLLWCALGAT
jgi:hypothetical protein